MDGSDMLNDLLNQAQDSSPEKRHKLVEHVTDLFVTGAESYQTEEISLFNAVLERMLPTMEHDQKKDVSERLAPIDSTSQKIAYELASDEIDVARPMLTSSNALKSDDILRLAKTMGQGHLLAISQRDHLEAKVTDVLLERGESPVKRSVAANSGAELSDWGGRLLVKLAERDDKIRDAMIERSDVSEDDYEKLISQMPEVQQAKIRKMREENEQLVLSLFHEASKVVASTKLERKNSRINVKVALKDIREGRGSINQAMTQLSLSNNLFDICFLLAQMAGLDQKYVTNVMVRYDATGVAVLCKAMGVDKNGYTALCRARATNNKQPQTTVQNWINDYQELTEKDARRLLSFMKIRLSTLEEQAA
ncbi:DUF2336 domain-containing protein [uncultured Roseibium sp.]|uniref:DUF2336 domain-containing protein n=1 Tax=uncultured Roseibium sp. TaxID=1936171 RepID=UPI0026055CF9|nr:DUF2336 domain-containing protein [uncultured Roseibium sp.]